MPRTKKPVDPNAPPKEKRHRVTTLERTVRLLAEQSGKLRKQLDELRERKARLIAEMNKVDNEIIQIKSFLPDPPEGAEGPLSEAGVS